jgi:hypothetical protein
MGGLFLLQSPVFADGANDWNPQTPGPVTTWTAPVESKGQLYIQPFFFYNIVRGNFGPEGHYQPLGPGNSASSLQEQVKTTYGITDKLECNFQTVYQENYAKSDGQKAENNGFGDSYLWLRYQVLDDHDWVPTVTPMFQLKMPTGKYEHLDPDKLGTDSMGAVTGGGSWDPGIGINATKKLQPFILHADVIYGMPQKVSVDTVETRYGNYINCDAAIEYVLPYGFSLMTEVNGLIQGDEKDRGAYIPDTEHNSLTTVSGIGWSNNKIQMLIGYQRLWVGSNVQATDSVVGMFIYNF